MRSYRVVLLVVAAVVATALPAKACSCAMGDPRDQLKAADGAFVGTLLSKAPTADDPTESIYTFTVEESFKGTFGETVEVNSATDGASCGLEVPLGQQTGLFLRFSESKWWSNLCLQIGAEELRKAAEPLPEPNGEGPIKMLVSGSYGEAGIVALDAQGRTLAYGTREPASSGLEMCPGSGRFLEIFGDGRRPKIAVRQTATLDVLREIDLPFGSRPYRHASISALSCADSDARKIFVAGRKDDGTGFVMRVRGDNFRRLYAAPVGMLDFVGQDLYVTEGGRGRFLVRLDLIGREREGIATLPVRAFQPRLSPNGRWIVLTAGGDRGKLVVVNRDTGNVRVEPLGVGYSGEALWMSNRRIAYLPGGYDNSKVEIFTRRLERVDRLPGDWYAQDNFISSGVAYGFGWGTLYRAELPSGPAETLRQFDSPVIYWMVEVPDEVEVATSP